MMPTSVDDRYVHRDKHCTPRDPINAGETRLKWYDLASADTRVPEATHVKARELVSSLSRPGDLGFVILHRCGQSFYFLLIQTWVNENELWETAYAKASDDHPEFTLWPRDQPHKPTFCVWELGAVWAEQQAWRRYLLSSRDEAAKRAYLSDLFEGAV
jgi:hypothetical protein